ncbi:hypothetical protein M8818_000482 [Zalaria obscura]|uniref:Uncharacterized protein n=1 Tax=Zalaria obscura TaxID=2024903 RepID=A0ACC3SP63_9PEZI
MSWRMTVAASEPSLPPHCEPASDFLFRFSSTFHVCVPTNLAFVSTTLGTLSIISWLFAQLPQIYKNYSLKSTSGLSIYFLVEWCLGDLSNLLGAVSTKQASWQIIIAGYYCFVDFSLVLQWLWYEHFHHGHTLRRVWPRKSRDGDDDYMQRVVIEGVPALSGSNTGEAGTPTQQKASAKDIGSKAPKWRIPDFEQARDRGEKSTPTSRLYVHRTQPSSSIPSPSPRTVLFIACLISLATASPIQPTTPQPSLDPTMTSTSPTPLENAGTILSWLSTALYLFSRLPQLVKNARRRSTSGLSPHLFLAAFFGNLFYSTSMLTNPLAWGSYPAHGAGGWVGAEPSDRGEWIIRALPFWLGAAGVLGLDGAVGVQFTIYGEKENKVVVVEEDAEAGRWRWRRVSGWMRGWVPSFSEPKGREEESGGLLVAGGQNEGYGTVN